MKFHYRQLAMCAGVGRDLQYQHTPSVDGSYIFASRRSELWPRIAPSERCFIWVVSFFSVMKVMEYLGVFLSTFRN